MHPEIVLLSAQLPDIDAVTLITALRRMLTVPIIVGIGPSDAEITVHALQAGATACVARPYRNDELLRLITSLSRSGAPEPLRVGDVELDEAAHHVRVCGKDVHLPLQEFKLLRYLMVNAGRLVTMDAIARNV
ncbi:hypothetical protein [Nonomuraea sp. NPDC003709]|uniref:response regulator transcription factor n=1 Tax=Nonomuraea sp. NPDC003709 TaxID=3154450 RepID=UPI00339FB896